MTTASQDATDSQVSEHHNTPKQSDSFCKDAFTRTKPARQKQVLDAAIEAFAANGYAGTNINYVAQAAGISIGAMYSYFASKKDLYLTIVSQQYLLVDAILKSIDTEQEFFRIIENLFTLTRDNALKYPLLSQIYMDVTNQSMAEMAQELSDTFENNVADFLIARIEHAKANGDLRADTNTQLLAFCIDNLLIMFQFSFSSAYYQERMRLYLGSSDNGTSSELSGDALIKAMVRIIKNQL